MGIVRANWSDIRSDIEKVEPIFCKEIDLIEPSDSFPLYKLNFPFGDLIGDDKSQFIPTDSNEYIRLSSPELPNDIKKDLGYGVDSSPFGLVLNKAIEFFVDLPKSEITLPIGISYPGDFLNFSRIFTEYGQAHPKPLAPNGLTKAIAGARTTFSMPYLTCSRSFSRLEKSLGSLSQLPNSQYDHHQLFKDIVTNHTSDWEASILYFSRPWIDSILHDPKWNRVKSYLFNKAWGKTEHKRNQSFFDIFYSLLKEHISLRKNPTIYDTARSILDIAIGAFPGLAPATDDTLLPINIIQQVLCNNYGLKKYFPTLIVPTFFDPEINKPVYYCLQNPTSVLLNSEAHQHSSALSNLEELRNVILKIIGQICGENSIWNGTYLKEILETISIDFIHSKSKNNDGIDLPHKIIEKDSSFNFITDENLITNKEVSSDSSFFRGCVSLHL